MDRRLHPLRPVQARHPEAPMRAPFLPHGIGAAATAAGWHKTYWDASFSQDVHAKAPSWVS